MWLAWLVFKQRPKSYSAKNLTSEGRFYSAFILVMKGHFFIFADILREEAIRFMDPDPSYILGFINKNYSIGRVCLIAESFLL
ncbi:MAG: hypothetical protein PWQ82_1370 [Thermosediminibacterales bacterium]|nr:hypothetical protein [Thermosediminibacterales bacterium]